MMQVLYQHIIQLKKKNLRLKALGFYVLLQSLADSQGQVKIKTKELAMYCEKASAMEIKRLRDELMKFDLIQYKKGSKYTVPCYQLNHQYAEANTNRNISNDDIEPIKYKQRDTEKVVNDYIKTKETVDVPEEYM